MNIDLTETRKKTVPISQYIDSLKQPFKEEFVARKHSYILNQYAIAGIKKFADKYLIVAFSAE
ncbi:MAG: hypothetical protein QME50_00455 [Candidatus Bathyarchaeota archaeon]|nr:hypothetical protein [Candidatus Bathyarchaeota archaeon]